MGFTRCAVGHCLWHLVVSLLGGTFALALASPLGAEEATETAPFPPAARTKIVLVVGPSTHPPGTHEVGASARLLADCLHRAEAAKGLEPVVCEGWPEQAVWHQAACLVFTGDLFPPETLPQHPGMRLQLAEALHAGCGLVCLHYATGLRFPMMKPDGDHDLLRWMGGYFATGEGAPNRSVARAFEQVTITPVANNHPVTRGWHRFSVPEEPYYNNYFGKEGLKAPVVALATSMLPPENPTLQVVGWGLQRPDGGRGVGIVMPHYYRNWREDNLRTFILNAVVWASGRDVPAEGVRVPAPDLARFKPMAVEPLPAKPVKPRKAKSG